LNKDARFLSRSCCALVLLRSSPNDNLRRIGGPHNGSDWSSRTRRRCRDKGPRQRHHSINKKWMDRGIPFLLSFAGNICPHGYTRRLSRRDSNNERSARTSSVGEHQTVGPESEKRHNRW